MERKGIDYFPLSIDFFEDNNIALIEAKFSNEGMMVLLKLLCSIYRRGFYLEWDEDYCTLFARKAMGGADPAQVQATVEEAVKRGFFDKNCYDRYHILTSAEIQKQFFFVAGRRKGVWITEKDYILIDLSAYKNIRLPEETEAKQEDVGISTQNVDIVPEKEDSLQHSIVEYSKEKESKENCERVSAREQWQMWKKELLNDEDWRASAVRQSGQGIGFTLQVESMLDTFCDYLVSSNEQDTVKNKKDFTRRYHFWWQYHGAKQLTAGGTWQQNQGCGKRKPLSRIEEINRIGDESLEIARRIMRGEEIC